MRKSMFAGLVAAAAATLVLPGLAGASPDSAAARASVAVGGFKPASGVVSTAVTIRGSGLAGATGVAFNGTPAASFTVDSDKQITATVAPGTTSGPITVSTPSATPTSHKDFGVITKVSLAACSGAGGNRNIPAGTYPLLQLGWDMASSDYLKPFLKSTRTTVTVDGKSKNGQKYWDKTGVDDGGGGWRTDFLDNPRILLATPGETTTVEVHQLVKKSFSDGSSTYTPGTDLWAGLGACTVHAV